MSAIYWILLLVLGQRAVELALAAHNTARLKAIGAVEIGASHYPLFIVLHGSWLFALLLTVPADRQPDWWLIGLFLLLQLARVWVVLSLGRYWTTRIITLPGAPLVRRGPYRWLKHPNYLVVAGEIALLPLAFRAWSVALLWSMLNAALLWHRIRLEDQALASRAAAPATATEPDRGQKPRGPR